MDQARRDPAAAAVEEDRAGSDVGPRRAARQAAGGGDGAVEPIRRAAVPRVVRRRQAAGAGACMPCSIRSLSAAATSSMGTLSCSIHHDTTCSDMPITACAQIIALPGR